MKLKRKIVYCFYGLLSIVLFSCEYYLGFNQQPKFNNGDIIGGLNIFGVLRPDSIESYNKSFVFVQKIWPVLDMDNFTIIQNVTVRLEHLSNNEVTDVTEFPMVPPDSLFSDSLYRPLEHFIPQPGIKYRLICQYEGLPDAMGECVFPPKPKIIENSLSVDGNNVTFALAADSLIGMVDIYLIGESFSEFIERLVPSGTIDTDVELQLPFDPQGLQIKIFAYDANLSVYYGNSNTAFNFNKYRTTISTLDSGFGVFGALNYIVIDL